MKLFRVGLFSTYCPARRDSWELVESHNAEEAIIRVQKLLPRWLRAEGATEVIRSYPPYTSDNPPPAHVAWIHGTSTYFIRITP